MIAALLGLFLALAVLVAAALAAANRSRHAVREVRVEAESFRPPRHPR